MDFILGFITTIGLYVGTLIATAFGLPLMETTRGVMMVVAFVIFLGPCVALLVWLTRRPISPTSLFTDVACHESLAHHARILVAPQVRATARILEEVLLEVTRTGYTYTHYAVDYKNSRIRMHYFCQFEAGQHHIFLPMSLFGKKPETQRSFIEAQLLKENMFAGVFNDMAVAA